MRSERWWVVPLYTYRALALAFSHQLATGAAFVGTPWRGSGGRRCGSAPPGRVLVYRVLLSLWRTAFHQLKVVAVEPVAPGVVSVIVKGRRLERLPLSGGVDPTGLVKGWAAREAAAVLNDAGVAAGLVNAAGDIATFGRPSGRHGWRVGLRSPETADRLLCVVDADGAVATSGSYGAVTMCSMPAPRDRPARRFRQPCAGRT